MKIEELDFFFIKRTLLHLMFVCLATVEERGLSKQDILEQNHFDHQLFAYIAIHFCQQC